MPKETNIESSIPTLYKRNALSLLMFGFVNGVRATLHTITIKEAVYMFMEAYGLNHDDYNSDSALVIYNRMQKDLVNVKKTSQ